MFRGKQYSLTLFKNKKQENVYVEHPFLASHHVGVCGPSWWLNTSSGYCKGSETLYGASRISVD